MSNKSEVLKQDAGVKLTKLWETHLGGFYRFEVRVNEQMVLLTAGATPSEEQAATERFNLEVKRVGGNGIPRPRFKLDVERAGFSRQIMALIMAKTKGEMDMIDDGDADDVNRLLREIADRCKEIDELL